MAQSRTSGRARALRYLVGTVTQGSADAFAEAEIITGLQSVGNVAFVIRELIFQFPGVPLVDAASIQLSITRKSFSVMPSVLERTLIYTQLRYYELVTSGAVEQSLFERVKFDADDFLIVVEDPIYLQIDSNATSGTNTGRVRIGYQQLDINEIDRLQLIADTLSS